MIFSQGKVATMYHPVKFLAKLSIAIRKNFVQFSYKVEIVFQLSIEGD